MEERGRHHLAIALVALCGVLYFFVCAIPLPKELGMVPRWAKVLPQAAPPSVDLGPASALASQASLLASGARLQSFVLPTTFGYFDQGGTAVTAAPVAFGVAAAPSGYVTYERESTALSLKAPSGKETAKLAIPGYPFFGGGRLFVVHPGQTSVSELSAKGNAVLWTYDFPSVVTAFDASPSLALFGLMDGSLVGLDAHGAVSLSFSPGGSKIPGIYGCAISPDGLLAAAVCGLDRQRLVVLEKRSSAYRVTYHRYLDSDFRRPVGISFTSDGSYLVYEKPSGLGIYDRAGRSEASARSLRLSGLGLYSAKRSILLAIEGSNERKSLLCFSPSGARLYSLSFLATAAYASLDGESVFMAVTRPDSVSSIVRIDFKEE